MKKLFLIIFLLPLIIYSQSISEKSLFKFGSIPSITDGSSIKVDDKSGTYLYQDYDSISQKDILFSNKGNSDSYSYIDYYNALFDSEGNYYVIAYNNITDTTYTYFILKNGKEIATYNSMNMSWLLNTGKIYFTCKENDKSYLAAYDIAEGKFYNGNKYDDIQLCNYPETQMEGEPEATVGFTKDGSPYYVAKSNNEAFLVVGTKEQKHYSDIDAYSVNLDSNGIFTFAAKSSGQFYNAGNTFVVKGDKEYKKFDYVYTPFYTDPASGDPVYIGTDSLADSSPQRVMIGDKEASKTYSGGLYNIQYTPSGKLYYLASEKKNKNDFASFVVFDDKEGKRYPSIGTIKVLPGDKLLYIANKSDNQALIVNGTKEIEPDYPTILDATILGNGKLAYIQGAYGDYNKKIKDEFYVEIGDDEYGPYNSVMPVNNGVDYFISDKSGNYVFVAQRLTNFKDYLYKTTVYSSAGESKEFDNIDNVGLYNGKPIYTASYSSDNTNYTYYYRIYYGNKPIGPEYETINNYKFDEKNKLITFTGIRNKEIFHVEIKF